MTQELTPVEAAVVDRFGIFEPDMFAEWETEMAHTGVRAARGGTNRVSDVYSGWPAGCAVL